MMRYHATEIKKRIWLIFTILPGTMGNESS